MVLSDDQIIELMDEVVDRFLVPRFRDELGMDATGEWLRTKETSAGQNKGIIRARDYTEYLVNGRAPGKMPPIAPIEEWVKAKMGLSGAQARGAAFAIATKISQEGTTWYQQGGTDLVKVLEEPECLFFIRQKITSLLTVRAKEEIEKFMAYEY